MASRTSTPQSRSRSSSGTSSSSDTTMMEVPRPPHSPSRPPPARLRTVSQSQATPAPARTPAPPTPYDASFSLLLSLPRELRDRVYTAALTTPCLISWPGKPPAKVRYHVCTSLLRASRQVYAEAVPILYSLNKLLFAHPSDCNVFRVIAAPAALDIATAYFRIREKDLRLWTTYLSSKNPERSLQADLPRLKNLWLFMRCGTLAAPAMLRHLGAGAAAHAVPPPPGLPPAMQTQVVQAVENTLGQAHHAQPVHVVPAPPGLPPGMQMQVHVVQTTSGQAQHAQPAHHVPPPPPPPPVPFMQFAQGVLGLGGGEGSTHGHGQHHQHHQHHQQHQQQQQQHPHPPAMVVTHILPINAIPPPPPPPPVLPTAPPLYNAFLKFERELGIEWLCLSLQDTLSEHNEFPRIEIKVVCIMRIPRREVERLLRLYPEELSVDCNGDARTRFWKLRGLAVCLELSGFATPEEREGEEGDGPGVEG